MIGAPVAVPSTGQLSGTDGGGRDIAIDYVRTTAVVLVVLIHAAGAYLSIGTRSEVRFLGSLEPVVDANRSELLNLFGVFDFFLMPTLFLVSGIVSLSSLRRRGSIGFFVTRLRRLGIPFVIGSLILAPLTHWPSYLLMDPQPQTSYLAMFFASGWPADHLWFIWLLLAFDGIVALANWLAPSMLAKLRRPPTPLIMLMVTIIAFVPLSLLMPNYLFVSLGPFSVEAARVGLYLAYFVLGTAIGAGDEWRRPGWPGRWWFWLVVGLVASWVYMAVLWPLDASGKPVFPPPVEMRSIGYRIAFGSAFAATCAGLSLAFVGVFRRYAARRRPVFESLNANSFGIYLVHYVFVIWLQFALRPLSWLAARKFAVVFIGALGLSWGLTALLRRIPAVRKII